MKIYEDYREQEKSYKSYDLRIWEARFFLSSVDAIAKQYNVTQGQMHTALRILDNAHGLACVILANNYTDEQEKSFKQTYGEMGALERFVAEWFFPQALANIGEAMEIVTIK